MKKRGSDYHVRAENVLPLTRGNVRLYIAEEKITCDLRREEIREIDRYILGNKKEKIKRR